MSKKEIIWRYILYEALTHKTFVFTQKDIAGRFLFSTSTVFNALKVPRSISAVEVRGRYFRLRDFEKLLILWATHRNLQKDIIYKTHIDATVPEIEGIMPPDVIFGVFSAYRLKYNNAPADYDQVYVYIYNNNINDIKKRFPSFKKSNKYPNLFVLKSDPYLRSFGSTTPDPQTFVDLWNVSQWYAKDFLEALKKRMNLS